MKQPFLFLALSLLLAACHRKGPGTGNAADSVYRKPHNSLSKGCDTFQSQHYVVPRQQGRVTDFEGILSKAEKGGIDSLCLAYQQETGKQLAVVTLTPTLAPKPVFDCYITLLSNTWGMGGTDNGMLVAVSEEDGMMRISVGIGLNAQITNDDVKAIIDTAFVPSFTRDKYAAGISKGIQALMQAAHKPPVK